MGCMEGVEMIGWRILQCKDCFFYERSVVTCARIWVCDKYKVLSVDRYLISNKKVPWVVWR